jgi:CubicO group peptidase (beta-lactamase class C family)
MRIDRRTLLGGAAASGLAFPFRALAQANGGDVADQVDAWAKTAIAAGAPGMALGVWQSGKTLITRGYGLADLESARPILPDTTFHVASVSKQFAAMSIALLASEGKVDLAADIRTYLPWMPDFGVPIRVEHLLHHVSGLRDQWTLAMAEGLDIRDLLTQARMKNLLRNQRALNFAPGSDYSYCNSGFTLLAEIVTVVSGQDLPAFAKARLFGPLGMTSSHFIQDAGEVIVGRAQSYGKIGATGWHKIPLNYETWGATSLSTTVADLLAWEVELLHPKTLSQALVDKAAAPYRLTDGRMLHYGFGMQALPVAGRNAVSHSGGDAGFRTFTARFPDLDAAIVVLRNDSGDPIEVTSKLLDIYWPATAPKPSLPPVLAASDPGARSILGTWHMEGSPIATIAEGPKGLTMKTVTSPARPLVVYADDTLDSGKTRGSFYRIHRDKAGKAIAIEPTTQYPTLDGGPRYTPAKLAAPGAAGLAAVAGRYRSAELDTTYVFTVKDGVLTSETLRGSVPLSWTPGIADQFDSSDAFLGTTMRVGRGKDGKVNAIFLEMGRSRKLRFDRVA